MRHWTCSLLVLVGCGRTAATPFVLQRGEAAATRLEVTVPVTPPADVLIVIDPPVLATRRADVAFELDGLLAELMQMQPSTRLSVITTDMSDCASAAADGRCGRPFASGEAGPLLEAYTREHRGITSLGDGLATILAALPSESSGPARALDAAALTLPGFADEGHRLLIVFVGERDDASTLDPTLWRSTFARDDERPWAVIIGGGDRLRAAGETLSLYRQGALGTRVFPVTWADCFGVCACFSLPRPPAGGEDPFIEVTVRRRFDSEAQLIARSDAAEDLFSPGWTYAAKDPGGEVCVHDPDRPRSGDTLTLWVVYSVLDGL